MAAYEELSIWKSIFQEQWVMSHPNAPTRPKIVRDADGKNGVIGLIENGVIQTIGVNPGAQVPTAIDRLERAHAWPGASPPRSGARPRQHPHRAQGCARSWGRRSTCPFRSTRPSWHRPRTPRTCGPSGP